MINHLQFSQNRKVNHSFPLKYPCLSRVLIIHPRQFCCIFYVINFTFFYGNNSTLFLTPQNINQYFFPIYKGKGLLILGSHSHLVEFSFFSTKQKNKTLIRLVSKIRMWRTWVDVSRD